MMIRAGVLDVAFDRFGDPSGRSVVLLHGFPYDPRGYDDVARLLAESGYDVVVPYLRGFGPTQFVDTDTMRSGEQAAIGHDLRELIIALELNEPIVAGYDWGGRAACVVAAMWPELISGLVSVSGYLIQDIAAAVSTPVLPHLEKRYWYQYYLHSERGRAGLAAHRAEFAQTLWTDWSPTWRYGDSEFAATAPSFDNPDFVDVSVHSYRHRYGIEPGGCCLRSDAGVADSATENHGAHGRDRSDRGHRRLVVRPPGPRGALHRSDRRGPDRLWPQPATGIAGAVRRRRRDAG